MKERCTKVGGIYNAMHSKNKKTTYRVQMHLIKKFKHENHLLGEHKGDAITKIINS
jgi:hypothetical protein